jgi:hypothetical protein
MTSIGALIGLAVGRATALDGSTPHAEFMDLTVHAVDRNADELVRHASRATS